jgi:ribosomal protein L37AE/L43A
MVVGYGKRIRELVTSVRLKSTRLYECPACSRNSVKRVAPAIWKCKKCSKKFASATYEFKG